MGVGRLIKEAAKEKGISLRSLAEKAGVSYNTLYSITKRDSTRVSFETIRKIAFVLGVPWFELLPDEERGTYMLASVITGYPQDNIHNTIEVTDEDGDEDEDEYVDEQYLDYISEAFARISASLHELNEVGITEAVERIEELTIIPKYQRIKEPPQPE